MNKTITTECKPLNWALAHMTITTDEVDQYGYQFRAEIKIKTRMINPIREYIRKNATGSTDSKKGMSYSIKVINDAASETEAFIGIDPNNVITFTYYSAKKPE